MEFRLDKAVMEGELGDFPGPVRHIKVDETKWEALWDRLMREHHYLGYESVIGSRVKYLVALGDRVVGGISFCSAAFKLGLRDMYIGWDEATRLAMLPHLVNNNRFLILPWVRIRNLASHVLSESLKQLRVDWQQWYGVEPYMAETFVDPERFAGTCYLAAGWTRLGRTKGYGRRGRGFLYHGQAKDLYVKVMSRRLAGAFHPDTGRLPPDTWEEIMAILNGPPVVKPEVMDLMGMTGLDREEVVKSMAGHLEPYWPFLGRAEHKEHFPAMIKGILNSEVKRKSIERIARQYERPGQLRALVNFMSDATWDDPGMLGCYHADLAKLVSAPGGMITVDGVDFHKNGKMTVGTHRQHSWRLGKVDNCQAAVFLGYASEKGRGLVDYDLYLPPRWLEDDFADKRKKCRVPADVEYLAKNQLALRQIRRISDKGLFQHKYLACDAAFGRDGDFLDSLPEGLIYFAEVLSNQAVFPTRPEMILPGHGGRGPVLPKPAEKPVAVAELAEMDEGWSEAALGMGAEGPFFAQEKCLRVVESRGGKPGRDVWLYIVKPGNGEVKYSLCNESVDASLQDIRAPAIMRWTMEQSLKECIDVLGMDKYEVRSWSGWRRHILLTLITHLFVSKALRQFGVKVDSSLEAPCAGVPAPMDESGEAVIGVKSEEKITNPNISVFPEEKQPVAFANWARLLSRFFPPTEGYASDDLKSGVRKGAAN